MFFLIAYATRLCTNESKWEEKGDYGLCIGCSGELSNSVRIKKKNIEGSMIIFRVSQLRFRYLWLMLSLDGISLFVPMVFQLFCLLVVFLFYSAIGLGMD